MDVAKQFYSVEEINAVFENKGFDFTFEQLLESNDDDINWWINLNYDWKIIIVYNHHRNSTTSITKIINFDSIITTINNYTKIKLKKFLAECKLMTIFHCSCYETYFIQDLKPISYLENLERLYCQGLQIINEQSISSLKNLTFIDFRGSNLDSLEMLAKIKGLEDLYIQRTKIKSLKGIENLTFLKKINFSNTYVDSIEHLKNAINLEYLSCFQTYVYDLEPLRNF